MQAESLKTEECPAIRYSDDPAREQRSRLRDEKKTSEMQRPRSQRKNISRR